MTDPAKAVVLLSGGIDSSTTMAVARDEGYDLHAMTFRYGQRHEWEINAARRIAGSMGVRDFRIVDIDLRQFGGSALTDDIHVPKNRGDEEIATGIPVTYVPARNTILLSYALGWAEVLGSHDIFIGVTAVDYSGYPDCRPQFITQFERLANVATREGGVEGRLIRIRAPLISLTKADIIRLGNGLGVDYGLTHSCYDPDREGMRFLRQCLILRKKGFDEAVSPTRPDT